MYGFMNTFAQKLKALRRGQTQVAFAKRLGIPQNTYHRYEAGERVPDIRVLQQIATRLDISADWLLDMQEETDHPHSNAPGTHTPHVAEKYMQSLKEKDRTIAAQAESIVNLSRSIVQLTSKRVQ